MLIFLNLTLTIAGIVAFIQTKIMSIYAQICYIFEKYFKHIFVFYFYQRSALNCQNSLVCTYSFTFCTAFPFRSIVSLNILQWAGFRFRSRFLRVVTLWTHMRIPSMIHARKNPQAIGKFKSNCCTIASSCETSRCNQLNTIFYLLMCYESCCSYWKQRQTNVRAWAGMETWSQ